MTAKTLGTYLGTYLLEGMARLENNWLAVEKGHMRVPTAYDVLVSTYLRRTS